jgi:hypothetical protein
MSSVHSLACARALVRCQRPRQLQHAWRLQSNMSSNAFSMSSVLAGNRASVYSTILPMVTCILLPQTAASTSKHRKHKVSTCTCQSHRHKRHWGRLPRETSLRSLSQEKDHPLFVGGNEGLGKVMDVGGGVKSACRRMIGSLWPKLRAEHGRRRRILPCRMSQKFPSRVCLKHRLLRLPYVYSLSFGYFTYFSSDVGEGQPRNSLQHRARLYPTCRRRLDCAKWCEQRCMYGISFVHW